MKLKYVAVLALTTALAGNANANMIYDFYIGATAGVGGQTLFADGDTSGRGAQSYGAVLGLDIPLLRIEGEYNYLKASHDYMQVAMANAYLKMPSGVLQPYIGAGVGAMFAGRVADIHIDTTAAYQAMLGLSINPPALPLALDIEGRALYAADVYNVNGVTPDVLNYEGRVKLRYNF